MKKRYIVYGFSAILIISLVSIANAQIYHDFPPTRAVSDIHTSNSTVQAKFYNTLFNFVGKGTVTVTGSNASKTIYITGTAGAGGNGTTLDTMQNVGTGQGSIYKGNDTNTNFQFKTLKQGSNIQLANNTNDVTISSTGWQNNTGINIGKGGKGFYASNSGSILQFRNLTSVYPNLFKITQNATDVRLNSTFRANSNTCVGLLAYAFTSFDNTTGNLLCTSFLRNLNGDFSDGQTIAATSPILESDAGATHTISCPTCATTSNANVTGKGSANQVTYWNTASDIRGATNLLWDNTNKILKGLSDTQTSLGTSTVRFLNIFSSVVNSTTVRTNTLGASTGSTISSPSDIGTNLGTSINRWNNFFGSTVNATHTRTNDIVTATTTRIAVTRPFVAGLGLGFYTKSSGATLGDTDDVVFADGTSGPFSLTLPSAAFPDDGKILTIKKIDSSLANKITIKTTSAQTIDGLTNYNLTQRGQTIIVQSDGVNWRVLSDYPSPNVSNLEAKGSTLNRWHGSAITAFTTTTAAPNSASLWVSPWIVGKTMTFDQIQLEVTTLVAASTCRMAIYSDNGNDYPGFIVAGSDVGTVSGASTGVKTNTFSSPITLQSGLYWIANQCSTSTTIMLREYNTPAAIPLVLGNINTMGVTSAAQGWVATNTFGALPTTYPAGGSVTTVSPIEILVRTTG